MLSVSATTWPTQDPPYSVHSLKPDLNQELINYYLDHETEILSVHETNAYQEVKYLALRKYKYLASIMEIEPRTHISWYQLLVGITTYLNAPATQKQRLRFNLIQSQKVKILLR